MAALIQFASGAPGIKYSLEKRLISIGRGSEGNDICLPCSFSSKHHAMIELVEEESTPGVFGVFLEDMDSRNHTYVNGEPINRVRLEDGDIIRIGRNTLKFDASGDMPNLESVEVDFELPYQNNAITVEDDTQTLSKTDILKADVSSSASILSAADVPSEVIILSAADVPSEADSLSEMDTPDEVDAADKTQSQSQTWNFSRRLRLITSGED